MAKTKYTRAYRSSGAPVPYDWRDYLVMSLCCSGGALFFLCAGAIAIAAAHAQNNALVNPLLNVLIMFGGVWTTLLWLSFTRWLCAPQYAIVEMVDQEWAKVVQGAEGDASSRDG